MPESNTINDCSSKLMSKIMQTFTLSYLYRNNVGPKIFVLFTNFTRYQESYQDDSDSD